MPPVPKPKAFPVTELAAGESMARVGSAFAIGSHRGRSGFIDSDLAGGHLKSISRRVVSDCVGQYDTDPFDILLCELQQVFFQMSWSTKPMQGSMISLDL